MYGRTFIPVEYTDDLKLPIERILDKTLTWESSDDKICKVLGGRLRPIRPGRVTITATTKYLDDSGID